MCKRVPRTDAVSKTKTLAPYLFTRGGDRLGCDLGTAVFLGEGRIHHSCFYFSALPQFVSVSLCSFLYGDGGGSMQLLSHFMKTRNKV